jgi:hypothetical protein
MHMRPQPQSLPILTAALRLRWLHADDDPCMMEPNAEPSTRRWLPSHVSDDPGHVQDP